MSESNFQTPLSLHNEDDFEPEVDGCAQNSVADDDETQDMLPLLSVLNVVVDHIMVPPISLECWPSQETCDSVPRMNIGTSDATLRKAPDSSAENKTNSDNIRVPVLRVFGPIVRRDTGKIAVPRQSACLYIHGAFPYLLARPVVAGPDGSIDSYRVGSQGQQTHVDWDSVQEVKAILPMLQDSLERALQSSMQQIDESAPPPPPFIRRITVVVGRGFYTYCPGPPAPFLRVEYYNPKDRWRVKMMMERGLDVPLKYHPDPRQYCAPTTALQQQRDFTTEALSFNCYEAHIPYTMQFFKDYNLAGMSYIHVVDGRFRRLPDVKDKEDEAVLFLRSNTSGRYMWPEDSEKNQGRSDDSPSYGLHSFWMSRETSCDVEFDTTVDEILNVQTVMKSLPEDEEERLKIHWRAVPSLREVWLQERRRWARLLKPKEDIVTQMTQHGDEGDDNIPCSLTSKKGGSLSGGALASLGMKRLLDVSQNLSKELYRCMEQIVGRHLQSIVRMDRLLHNNRPQPVSASALLQASQSSSVGSLDSAVEALGALGSQFEDSYKEDDRPRVNFQSSPESQEMTQMSHPDHFTQESLSLSQGCLTQDPMDFTQRVDRGESVFEDDELSPVDERIDPRTLTPYDEAEFDEEDELSEGELEEALSVLATQLTSTELPSQRESPDRRKSSMLAYESDSEDSLATRGKTQGKKEDREADTSFLDGLSPLQQLSDGNRDLQRDHALSDPLTALSQIQAPPSARNLFDSKQEAKERLHPLQPTGRIAPWMSFSARYSQLHRPQLSGEISSAGLLADSWAGRSFEPVRGPPSRLEVERWARKRKRTDSRAYNRPTKKAGSDQPKEAIFELRIDGSSRKLTAIAKASRKRQRQFVFSDVCETSLQVQVGREGDEIEDVDLSQSQLSQTSSLSPSQNEQPAESNPRDANPTNKLDQFYSVGSSTSTPDEAPRAANDTATADSGDRSESQSETEPLQGIGQQGGRIYVEGGGGLKAKTRASQLPLNLSANSEKALEIPAPVTVMSVEIHVQCRKGKAGVTDSKEIAMKPDFRKDVVSAAVYVLACDPGGGEPIKIIERGCLLAPLESEEGWGGQGETDMNRKHKYEERMKAALPSKCRSAQLKIEAIRSEKSLLYRLAHIIRCKDPDMLLSWDTQGAGLGYIVARGTEIGLKNIADLLGRTPSARASYNEGKKVSTESANQNGPEHDGSDGNRQEPNWKGSGLGSEWDERVGAGAAAASIVGRLVFAGWKVVAEEVKHPNSSYLPAMVGTILNKRIPFHDDILLTAWYAVDEGRERWRVLNHRLQQAEATILMFDALDVIGRAGEAARLSGVEFSQSFPGIRGSQYKVEGVLLRALQSLDSDERGSKRGRQKVSLTSDGNALAIDPGSSSLSNETKSQSQSPFRLRRKSTIDSGNNGVQQYFFFSPSREDCTHQEALECQALTLEPKSGFQDDPVVVCDFTALYPSLVIAYNLCYSTIVGKLEYHSTRQEMQQEGRTTEKIGPFHYAESRTAMVLKDHLKSLEDENSTDRAYAAPTGSIFVSEGVLKGVLPQVLKEILETRAMLKKAAKQYKKLVPGLSPAILRQLEARQLALKYVANVTYGYTSATFSGRCAMPLLADTIVECGRRTLSNAIALANQQGADRNGRWSGAEVIYGDTDSIFIKLPGRSVKEAFEFGEWFCRRVKASNPAPIELKLEKVYRGSMMQTKKKYCGMKYESADQKKPEFEAKGIETVRKDQCALTQKVLRNTLVTLFHHGINAVKPYLERQWSLIRSGRLPVSDFILTGRVRSRYRNGASGPVQAVLARRLAEADPGRVIRHKERLAYVIVATPGRSFTLKDAVMTPMEAMERWDAFTIHSTYYIERHVNAALQRCLGLAPYNIDVNAWYTRCPKPRLRIHFWPVTRSGQGSMITSFFVAGYCSFCGEKCNARSRGARAVVCETCQADRTKALHTAMMRLQKVSKEAQGLAMECSKCNLCYEDAATFGVEKPRGKGIVTPLANCSCIDCPVTYERHRLREAQLEAEAIVKALPSDVEDLW